MKKLILSLCLIIGGGLYSLSYAQISVNVNINVNKQPAWGPTGYDYVGFYYFPDINVYFDVNSALFHYSSGSKWISNQYLPDKYRKYDLYSLYKVVVNESQPWEKNKTHKKEYSQYKGDKTQTPIRNSTDSRYSTSKSNTHVWVNTDKNDDNGNNKQSSNQESQGNKNNNSKESSGKNNKK